MVNITESLADYLVPDLVVEEDDTKVVIEVPGDKELLGVALAKEGSSPLPKVPAWWKGKELVVRCLGRSSIVPEPNTLTYGGNAVTLAPGAGKVTFENFDFHAGGREVINAGKHKSQEKTPIVLTLRKCSLLGQPSWAPANAIRYKWGILSYQTAVRLESCHAHLEGSKEHVVYSHNPCAELSWMLNSKVTNCGGQVWQEVNRQIEGPNYEGEGGTILNNNFCTHYHQDDSRASFAFTIAGSGKSALIENNVLIQPWGEESKGAIVVSRGGNLDGHGGLPDWYGPEVPVYENDNRGVDDVIIRNNLIYHKNPSRQLIKLASFRRAILTGNLVIADPVWGTLLEFGDGEGSNAPEDIYMEANNGEEAIENAIDYGFPDPQQLGFELEGIVKMADIDVKHKITDKLVYSGTDLLEGP